jgi:hypothetical protein
MKHCCNRHADYLSCDCPKDDPTEPLASIPEAVLAERAACASLMRSLGDGNRETQRHDRSRPRVYGRVQVDTGAEMSTETRLSVVVLTFALYLMIDYLHTRVQRQIITSLRKQRDDAMKCWDLAACDALKASRDQWYEETLKLARTMRP